MASSRREFIRDMGVGLSTASIAAAGLARAQSRTASDSEKLLVPDSDHPTPAPLGVDRLPLEWHQGRTRILKERAAERGVDAVLLSSDQNMVYFTGCFRQSGERSTWVLFPVEETDTVYWYSPGIDRDLVTTWWATENEYYFCYPHAEGGFPNRGELKRGNRVDLFDWLLQGLANRGLGEKTLGVDFEPSESQKRAFASVLPKAKLVGIGDICLDMQIVKTPQEIALTQRAYRYFDKVHAFARDYILEHGTNATDFEVGQALQAYGIGLLMNDVKYDGRPHSAVGIEVTSHYVRTGVATAYPHPNQFFYTKIEKGAPVYVNTDIKLGGMGGEGYRNYVIAPFDSALEKMWQVVTDSALLLREEVRPGRACSEVAYKVHEFQIKNGMQSHIYHRPCHGQGQFYSGHQPPFIALGDDTPIQAGMMFSVEPGLYDAERGIGVNPSDILLVLEDKSVFMSSVPFTREWAFLTL
ncbi:MAG TPA: M24 family metallopeptidase [Vicinamibacteria bacterium]|nr:M24 family metallopeptidase [Vicinamibacteria bacterium]